MRNGVWSSEFGVVGAGFSSPSGGPQGDMLNPPLPEDESIHPAFGSDSGERTLASEINQSGVGLHSGISTHVRILPAAPGQGRYFVRVDLSEQPTIPARVEVVEATVLSTQLSRGPASVRTVEHLLAALAGMGVDNARIEIDGPELPLLDGSARVWVEAIDRVGLVSQVPGMGDRPVLLKEPIWVYQGDAFVAALPAPYTRFTYGIDFDLPAIGSQWHSWSPSGQGEQDSHSPLPTPNSGKGGFNRSPCGLPDGLEKPAPTTPHSALRTPHSSSFAAEIAPARTFGLVHQIDHLREAGLIKGGSLDNALVCGPEGWLNPPLRFANEPVRHKILDLVGDLSLLGSFPIAHFLAYKASHNLHIQLAQLLQKMKNES